MKCGKSRRGVLKACGTGVVGLVGASVSTRAKSRNITTYERSLELRENAHWSNEKWRSWLKKQGVDHGVRKRKFAISKPNANGDVTTQKYDSYECWLYMTYTRPSYVNYRVIDLEWEHKNLEADDYGEYPEDNGAISFRAEHYSPTSRRDDWVYYGYMCDDPDDVDSKTPSGAVCDWSDVHDNDGGSYFGIYVDPNWEDHTEHDREVYFDYVHTWSGYGLNGLSIGSDGIGLQFSNNTDRWDIEDKHTEAQLIDGETASG